MYKFLENKIPPPIIALLFALIIWLISLISPIINIDYIFKIIIPMITFVIGFFFGIAGVLSFRRERTTIDPLKPENASSLVTCGIYQISRNPMYLGLSFLLTSFVIYLASPLSLIGVLGFVIYITEFQIKPEERILERMFNTQFNNYKLNVRRWI